MMSADAAPAQVVGNPGRLEAGDERLERARYASSSGIAEPIDSETPCNTTGASVRARSRAASGRPPAIMKFSEIASNQSTRAVPSQSRGKCGGRSPTP